MSVECNKPYETLMCSTSPLAPAENIFMLYLILQTAKSNHGKGSKLETNLVQTRIRKYILKFTHAVILWPSFAYKIEDKTNNSRFLYYSAAVCGIAGR